LADRSEGSFALDSGPGRLLSAALNLWVERGYEAVGVQEICDAAQVTKPTLYHYFGSKAGLLRAIVELNGQRLAEFLPARSFDPSMYREHWSGYASAGFDTWRAIRV
jgi:AcrR family transcriptional regulator